MIKPLKNASDVCRNEARPNIGIDNSQDNKKNVGRVLKMTMPRVTLGRNQRHKNVAFIKGRETYYISLEIDSWRQFQQNKRFVRRKMSFELAQIRIIFHDAVG